VFDDEDEDEDAYEFFYFLTIFLKKNEVINKFIISTFF
jgi:hypothetical protein